MGGHAPWRVERQKAPMSSADEKYLSGLTDEEMEKTFRERWEEVGGTWTKNGTANMAKLRVELEKADTVTYQLPKRSRYHTPRKLKEATLAATKEKLKGVTMRLVACEAHQRIPQLFVKGKGKRR